MDRINIINNEVSLNIKRLGKSFYKRLQPNQSNNHYYRIYKDAVQTDSSCFLTIIVNDEKGRGFKIDGSLRKWWYGNRSIRDLDFYTFSECLDVLAKKLGITSHQLLDSGVTYLEIGGNIRLHRKYDFIIPSMISYPRLQKIHYTEQTTYFKSRNRTICSYDKVMEIYKHGGLSKTQYEKISKNIFVMRYEHKLTTPSGTNLRGKMNTLYKIKINWNFLIDDWEDNFRKIQFAQFQKPKLVDSNKFMTRTELKNFAIAIAVKNEGFGFFNNVINSRFNPNHKSQERKNLVEICKRSNVENSKEDVEFVLAAIKNKADKLKRKSREL